MSRSKNKIAVTTLLSALAFSATTTSAAGTNERNIKSVESQTSFSTRKSSESSIKSARSLEGARSWFQKIPTWTKIAIGSTFLTVAMAETYNEIAGAISGKKWYSGKYSFANLGKSIGEKVGQKPGGNNDKNPNISGNYENQDEIDNNIKDKTDNEIYTNSGNTAISDKKDNTGLGAAPSSLTKEQEEQLNTVLKAFEEAANEVSGLYKKFEEKLKDGLIKIIKGKLSITDRMCDKCFANEFIDFVKGKNCNSKVKIMVSNGDFYIRVKRNSKSVKKFAVSIVNDKLKIGDNLILLD